MQKEGGVNFDMVTKVIKSILTITSSIIFYTIFHMLGYDIFIEEYPYFSIILLVVTIIFGLIFYFLLSKHITNYILKNVYRTEDKLTKMNLKELLMTIAGATIGLCIANLIGLAFHDMGVIGVFITVLLNLLLGILGIRVARRKKDDLSVAELQQVLLPALSPFQTKVSTYGCPKILDTSVIIDGRILDILQTGFIEGDIIIPNFVLTELQHIADSSDDLKRQRGRRGLDILNEIQKQLIVAVQIKEFQPPQPMEVDSMLLKMAQEMDAFVVTNDFNLNKVAEFQGVKILNINELANAIKPIVLPAEQMQVVIVKQGKESGQGVAYLNDGTMIVVEGGNQYIGETKTVIVTSVLQTSAGRMIFAKL